MSFTAAKTRLLGKQREMYGSTFLLALLTATVVFVPFIIADRGYFLFYGDFNVQQIPFYKLVHEAIRSGNYGWNWNTDLGVNLIGSYSFYLMGSPFFWITLLFPNSFVPFLMGPLLILKFALSALTAYCYLRRFTRTPSGARAGALMYAFSGFSVYNIFFNHFHEAIIVFPLLLLSVELLITENRRGFFAAMVALSAVMNYFFFFGMVVFTVIYWFVRVLSGCYEMKFSRFLAFVFEAVLGLLISAALLWPTFLALYGNSRLSEISVGWNAIMYGKEQIYLNIFQCFFFPPDLPARPVFFPGADVKWSSLGGWLPLFSMVGVFAFLQQKKHDWLRRIIGIMIFMALVPVLNSSFYMFNSAYYARWYYMLILMMCLATVRCAESTTVSWRSAFKWVFGITAAAVVVIGFFPSEVTDGKIAKWGLYTNSDSIYFYRFLATSAIALISLVMLGLLLKMIKSSRKQFFAVSTALICIISAIYSVYFIACGKTHSYDTESVMINSLLESDLKLPGDSNTYRIDVYDGVDNTAMYLGYSSINAFHSIVPVSVTDFWEYVGEERGVASRPSEKSYAARSLLGVKYLLARKGGESFTKDTGETVMPGFVYLSSESGYDIYENKNYLPFGFSYDYYMTEAQCGSREKEERSNMMLKAVLLDDNQIAKYGSVLKNIDEIKTSENSVFKSSIYDFECNDEELVSDVSKLKENAVSDFSRTSSGFTAKISTSSDRLVFFSVPYEKGWSATVNGKSVDIEKVNVGFMAVLVPEGESTITFTYKTPGLKTGIIISAGAVLMLIAYSVVCALLAKSNKMSVSSYPEGDRLLEEWKDDVVNEKMQQSTQEYSGDVMLTDEGEEEPDWYSGSSPSFDRGFWINTEESDNDRSNDDSDNNTDNKGKE